MNKTQGVYTRNTQISTTLARDSENAAGAYRTYSAAKDYLFVQKLMQSTHRSCCDTLLESQMFHWPLALAGHLNISLR